MENKKLILENLGNMPYTFYNLLSEGKFDTGKYNELIYNVCQLNDQIGDQNIRSSESNKLWELFFMILALFYADANLNDVYCIDELNQEKKSTIINDLYYLGNQFTRGLKVEFQTLFV